MAAIDDLKKDQKPVTAGGAAPATEPATTVVARSLANNPNPTGQQMYAPVLDGVRGMVPSLTVGASATPTVRAMGGGLPASIGTYDDNIATMRSQLAPPRAAAPGGQPEPTGEPGVVDSLRTFNPSAAVTSFFNAPQRMVQENASNSAAAEAHVKSLYPKGTFDNIAGSPPPSAPTGAPAPATTVTPAAAPATAAAPAADTPSLEELLAKQRGGETSAVGGARVFIMPNGQKMFTNLADNDAAIAGLSAKGGMGGEAPAGMQPPGNPTLGTTQDSLRQLQNIMALRGPEPGQQAAVLDDGTGAANAEKTRRWRVDDMMSRLRSAGTSGERAAMGQAINTLLAGDNQQAVATMQAETQRRGQDVNAATAKAGQGVQMRGQDLGAKSAADQLGLGMRRLDQDGVNSELDRKTRLQIADRSAALDERRIAAVEKDAAAKGEDVEWKQDMRTGLYYNAKAKNPQLFDIGMIAQMQKLTPAK